MKTVHELVEGFACRLHHVSDVDGFVHNCIAHPLLWVAVKLERFT